MVKVGGEGSVIYVIYYFFLILFGSWDKISTGTLS